MNLLHRIAELVADRFNSFLNLYKITNVLNRTFFAQISGSDFIQHHGNIRNIQLQILYGSVQAVCQHADFIAAVHINVEIKISLRQVAARLGNRLERTDNPAHYIKHKQNTYNQCDRYGTKADCFRTAHCF